MKNGLTTQFLFFFALKMPNISVSRMRLNGETKGDGLKKNKNLNEYWNMLVRIYAFVFCTLGGHTLSGACLEPRALNELMPDWEDKGVM